MASNYVFMAEIACQTPPPLGHLEDALPSPFTRGLWALSACRGQFVSLWHMKLIGLLGEGEQLMKAVQLTQWMCVHRVNLLDSSWTCVLHVTGVAQGNVPVGTEQRASLGTSSSLKGFSNSVTAQAAHRAARTPVLTPKMRGSGTSTEPGVWADKSSAWEISWVRTVGTVISERVKEATLAYTRVCAWLFSLLCEMTLHHLLEGM